MKRRSAPAHKEQQQDARKHDEDADELRRGQCADGAAVVAAEELDDEAPYAVAHQVPAGGGAVPLLTAENGHEYGGIHEAERRLKQLRRQQRHACGGGDALRINDRDRGIALRTVTTAGAEAANAAKALRQDERGHHQIEVAEERLFAPPREQQDGQRADDQRSVKHKAGGERFQDKVRVGDDPVELHDPVEGLGAKESADDRPDRHCEQVILGKGDLAAVEIEQHECGDHAEQHHHAKRGDGKTKQMDIGMHGLPFCPRTGCGLRRASGGVCADGGYDEHDQRNEAEQQADKAAPAPDCVFAVLRDVDALRIPPHQKPCYQRRRAGEQGKRQERRDKRQHERSDAQHKREDRGAPMAVHLQRIIDRRAGPLLLHAQLPPCPACTPIVPVL